LPEVVEFGERDRHETISRVRMTVARRVSKNIIDHKSEKTNIDRISRLADDCTTYKYITIIFGLFLFCQPNVFGFVRFGFDVNTRTRTTHAPTCY